MARKKVDQELRAGLLWSFLVGRAGTRKVATYREASEAIGIFWRALRYPLGLIQDDCLRQGYPPLTALVVAASTGRPGAGFASDPLDDSLRQDVFDFNWKSMENPFSQTKSEDIERMAHALLKEPGSATDIFRCVKSRGDQQRLFRRALMQAYEAQCAFCGLSFTEALEAAHIVPWVTSKPEMRIDPRNGILLCSNHHALFGADWITINTDMTIEYHDDGSDHGKSDEQCSKRLHNQKMRLPADDRNWPLTEFIIQRNEG